MVALPVQGRYNLVYRYIVNFFDFLSPVVWYNQGMLAPQEASSLSVH